MPPDPAPRFERSPSVGPFRSCLSLESEGLVLGNGTVLAGTRYDPFGRRQSTEDRIEFRLLALLSIAYGEAISPYVLGHIRKAWARWDEGEACRALIHLAFTRLPRIDEASAARLALADDLIDSGVPLAAIAKLYDGNETRVPAGEGRESGRWTVNWAEWSAAAARMASRLPLIARLATGIGGLVAFFDPERAGHSVEGQIGGGLDLRYAWNEDERYLRVMQPSGRIMLQAVLGDDGVFRDERGREVAMALDDHVVIDAEAVYGELPETETDLQEPKVCPRPGKDKAGRTSAAGEKDKDYEDYVKLLVNPEGPTPRGFGVQLPNPQDGNKPVFYDDCQRRSGILIEAKGTGYAEPMDRSDFMRDIFETQWLRQAQRQLNVPAVVRSNGILPNGLPRIGRESYSTTTDLQRSK